jgi:hypothetical protein
MLALGHLLGKDPTFFSVLSIFGCGFHRPQCLS